MMDGREYVMKQCVKGLWCRLELETGLMCVSDEVNRECHGKANMCKNNGGSAGWGQVK